MVKVPWQQGQVTLKAVGFAVWGIQKIVLHAESTRERNLIPGELGSVAATGCFGLSSPSMEHLV